MKGLVDLATGGEGYVPHPGYRPALLGEKQLSLVGAAPQPGDVLGAEEFSIPPARNADVPLTSASLRRGLTLLSTLPNISRHACAAQILELEEEATARLKDFRLVHVSADEPHFWQEVDHFHAGLRAQGYSLHGASVGSRESFASAFGVAVRGHWRIAHGMFALLDGMFIGADVPFQQLAVPDVHGFLLRVQRLLGRTPGCHRAGK